MCCICNNYISLHVFSCIGQFDFGLILTIFNVQSERRCAAQWHSRLTRNVSVVGSSPIKGHVVSLSKKLYPYCLVLVSFRNGLCKIEKTQLIIVKIKTKSTISPSIYFSSIVKLSSNPFLEPTSTKIKFLAKRNNGTIRCDSTGRLLVRRATYVSH